MWLWILVSQYCIVSMADQRTYRTYTDVEQAAWRSQCRWSDAVIYIIFSWGVHCSMTQARHLSIKFLCSAKFYVQDRRRASIRPAWYVDTLIASRRCKRSKFVDEPVCDSTSPPRLWRNSSHFSGATFWESMKMYLAHWSVSDHDSRKIMDYQLTHSSISRHKINQISDCVGLELWKIFESSPISAKAFATKLRTVRLPLFL